MAKRVAEILLEINAVELNTEKPFVFASGVVSPVYCDNRLLMGYPERRKEIVDLMVEVIEKEKLKFDVIAGVASSGIPLSTLLADRLNKPMVYVRKHAKSYGKGKRVEGVLRNGDRAIVIEDLISTGKSCLDVVDVLREEGAVVDTCLSVFTYNMKKAEKAFEEKKCKIVSLSNIDVLLDVAVSRNILSGKEKEMILEWRENPDKWREKHADKT